MITQTLENISQESLSSLEHSIYLLNIASFKFYAGYIFTLLYFPILLMTTETLMLVAIKQIYLHF